MPFITFLKEADVYPVEMGLEYVTSLPTPIFQHYMCYINFFTKSMYL